MITDIITHTVAVAIGFVLGAWWFAWITAEDIADRREEE